MWAIEFTGAQVLAVLGRAWRSLGARQIAGTAALCLAWSCCESARHAFELFPQRNFTPVINAILSMQFNGLAVLLGVSVANQTRAVAVHGSWWPYIPAVICSIFLGTTVMWIVSQHLLMLTTAYEPAGTAEPFRTFGYRHGVHALLICGLGAMTYVVHRRAAQRLAALHDAQLERANAERDLQLSRLAAMNARLDPQSILLALNRVERSYEQDRALGDQVLQSLVSDLRAAVAKCPESRHSRVTL